jgi:hypothetical protein
VNGGCNPNTSFASKAGLTILPATGMVALAGPSANVQRIGTTSPVLVTMGDSEAVISFEVMDLGSMDVILGLDSCTTLNWKVRVGTKVGGNWSKAPLMMGYQLTHTRTRPISPYPRHSVSLSRRYRKRSL